MRMQRPRGSVVLVLLATASLQLAAVSPASGARDITKVKPSPGAEAYFHFAMAKIAQQRQDFGAAVSLLREAAKADPESAMPGVHRRPAF